MKTVLIACFAILVTACGDTDPSPAGAPDAASSVADAGTPSAPDAAQDAGTAAQDAGEDATTDSGKTPCNSLANVGSEVAEEASPTAPPEATGGTLMDGTYVLTSAILYTGAGGANGPTGAKRRMTIRLTGTAGESVFDGLGRNATFVPNGTKLVITNTCPSNEVAETPFSATSTSLTIHVEKTSGTLVQVFNRVVQ